MVGRRYVSAQVEGRKQLIYHFHRAAAAIHVVGTFNHAPSSHEHDVAAMFLHLKTWLQAPPNTFTSTRHVPHNGQPLEI